MRPLGAVLQSRPYPGRGVLAARTSTGTLALVYFLTGRSPASRSRNLQVLPNGDVAVVNRTAGSVHDALRHYVAAARRGDWLVVGNGDQVVPLAHGLAAGRPVLQTWAEHTFEPDPPIFTSRIWVATHTGLAPEALLGFARRSHRGDGDVDRVAWAAGRLPTGTGVLMTTYDRSSSDVHATSAPEDVLTTAGTLHDLLGEVWEGLEPGLRVAAFAMDADDTRSTPLLAR